ncbi:MAG: SDR family oxidoreductase [Treponema sp.]|nr:SDR family oxidoreductase [Treponema sp.]
MKIVITGTSRGIGREAALKFLKEGHDVIGIDINPGTIENPKYLHFCADVSKPEELPVIDGVEILVCNAGIQTEKKSVNGDGFYKMNRTESFANEIPDDIKVNLLGSVNAAEKYAFQKNIKSVLFNASVSALNGNEFPAYVASKAGVVGYMKHCAIRLANEYHATCNALCFGGVLTELNDGVMKDKNLWQKIMDVTPLKRWTDASQAAEWIYFMTVTNTSCTGQAVEISNGERNCADLFVWPEL